MLYRRKKSVKMNLKEMAFEEMNCMKLAEDRDNWRPLLKRHRDFGLHNLLLIIR